VIIYDRLRDVFDNLRQFQFSVVNSVHPYTEKGRVAPLHQHRYQPATTLGYGKCIHSPITLSDIVTKQFIANGKVPMRMSTIIMQKGKQTAKYITISNFLNAHSSVGCTLHGLLLVIRTRLFVEVGHEETLQNPTIAPYPQDMSRRQQKT